MRSLTMKYAGGGIVRHLGLQNYKGPIPALSELIANAWDADSNKAEISIPLDRPFSDVDTIIVRDFGCGMSWNDCDNKYLIIARNRREDEKTDRTPSGRLLMAHKGLGKLAGFGIAKTLEIKTIFKGRKTQFIMSIDELDKLRQGESYTPTMISDEEDTQESDGTEIILRNLTLKKAINKEEYFMSMGNRFSILSNKFKVSINGEELLKTNLKLEFSFPEKIDSEVTKIDEDGFGTTQLLDGNIIKWKIGFTANPIPYKGFCGISITARGRVAQDPSIFDLAGGTWGQHGLKYITGEIIAEFVDSGISRESDTIITNRSGVTSESQANMLLNDWAIKKIKALLREWSERRGHKTLEKVKKDYPELDAKITTFQPREQKEINSAIKSLAQIPDIEPEKLARIANHVIDGYTDKVVTDLLKEMNEIPPENREILLHVLMEFDVLEAIRVHSSVRSYLEIITKFETMIAEGVKEKPDMHGYIRRYPWLLGMKQQNMDYEPTLQRVLNKYMGINTEKDEYSNTKPDFVCMKGGEDVLIIELKGPTIKISMDELQQTMRYVYYLRDWADDPTSPENLGLKIDSSKITGFLIGYDIVKTPEVRHQIINLKKDRINVCRWNEILLKTGEDYGEFRKIIRKRAPENDPRLKDIKDL